MFTILMWPSCSRVLPSAVASCLLQAKDHFTNHSTRDAPEGSTLVAHDSNDYCRNVQLRLTCKVVRSGLSRSSSCLQWHPSGGILHRLHNVTANEGQQVTCSTHARTHAHRHTHTQTHTHTHTHTHLLGLPLTCSHSG